MLSPSDRNRLRNNVSGKQHSTGIFHRISGERSITLFSSRFHVMLLDVVPVSDDGIERGAALARYRMHIDLPTTSLLSGGSLRAPSSASEALPSKQFSNVEDA